MDDLKRLYERYLEAGFSDEWHTEYIRAVDDARTLPETEWKHPRFQMRLWDRDEVANIGLGRSVNVSGAASDPQVVDALWALKSLNLSPHADERAKQLDAAFERVRALVNPKHNVRRPSARLVRIFAVLFPDDVLCLLDDRRTQALRRYLGMPVPRGMGLLGTHVIADVPGAFRQARRPVRPMAQPERRTSSRLCHRVRNGRRLPGLGDP